MSEPAESPVADRVYDAGGTLCGELALELRAALAALPAGGVLQVIARDAAAPSDLPAWCEVTGHTLLCAAHPDYWIRRKAERPSNFNQEDLQ